VTVTAIANAGSRAGARLPVTYVVPVRTPDGEPLGELALYLGQLSAIVDEVIVVDGSNAPTVALHRAEAPAAVTVMEPVERTLMGKVGNVMTGVRAARNEFVVLGDDDVRYTFDDLRRVVERLHDADVVRPQNYFDPLPWHARLDTARTALNRVLGGDWPGTLALRRSRLLHAGGYAGDVMFENFELVQTVRAAGGRESLALDILVRRIPPTTAHFRGQQVRQAYDEFARPARLVASLAVLPLTAALLLRRRIGAVATGAAAVTVAAEVGRRRAGGRRVFPASSVPLVAPWLVWRSACSWAALGARLRGGARYRGTRLARAATPRRELLDRVRAAAPL
jgi:hypothetical protein